MSSVAWRVLALWIAGFATMDAAAAPEVRVPTDAATLAEALTLVDPAGTVIIETTADVATERCVTLNQDLTILGEGERPSAPGIIVESGEVALSNLTMAGACTGFATRSGVANPERVETRLYVRGGSFTGSNLTLEPGDKPGLIVTDTDATVSGLVASGRTVWPAVVLEPSGRGVSLTLHDATFEGNSAGSIRANGIKSVGYNADLTIIDSAFVANYGSDAGDLYVTFGDLTISGSTFTGTGFEDDGDAMPGEAAFVLVHGGEVNISDSRFTECRARYAGAIAVSQQDPEIDSVTLERVTASRCAAVEGYGGLLFVDGGPVTVRDILGSELTADYGALIKVHPGTTFDGERIALSGYEVNYDGAIYLNALTSARLHRARLCGGRATQDGLQIGISAYDVGELVITNSVLHDLSSPSGAGIAVSGGDFTLRNNTLAGNELYSLVVAYGARVSVFNNIFAHSPGARAVTSWGDNTVSFSGYNLFYALAATTENFAEIPDAQTDVYDQEPGFWALWDDQDCARWPVLDLGSPAIDAGNPDTLYDDPDGTRADIGAFGGPEAVFPDEDGDGVTLLLDCDDRDPLRSPELEETPGDGLDNDCDDATPDALPGDDSGVDSGQDDTNAQLMGGCAGCAGAGGRGEIMTPLFILALLRRRSR